MEELWRAAEAHVGEFDAAAAAYDTYRPRYPEALFEVMIRTLDPCTSAVEVGAGTGIATAALVERGVDVTAVEPSPSMTAIAQSKPMSAASFFVGRFEDWPVGGPVDLVAAFNSWHWVDPAVAVPKAAETLRPGGSLALVWTDVIQYGQPPFAQRLEAVGVPASGVDSVTACRTHVEAASEFTGPSVIRRRFERTLDATTFLAVRRTYAAGDDDRTERAICRLIDDEFGGSVTKIEEAVAYLYLRE